MRNRFICFAIYLLLNVATLQAEAPSQETINIATSTMVSQKMSVLDAIVHQHNATAVQKGLEAIELTEKQRQDVSSFLRSEALSYYTALAQGEEPIPYLTPERDAKLKLILGEPLFEIYKKNQIDDFLKLQEDTMDQMITILAGQLSLSKAQSLQAHLMLAGALEEMESSAATPGTSMGDESSRQQVLYDRLRPILTDEQVNLLMQFEADDASGTSKISQSPEHGMAMLLQEKIELDPSQTLTVENELKAIQGRLAKLPEVEEAKDVISQLAALSAEMRALNTPTSQAAALSKEIADYGMKINHTRLKLSADKATELMNALAQILDPAQLDQLMLPSEEAGAKRLQMNLLTKKALEEMFPADKATAALSVYDKWTSQVAEQLSSDFEYTRMTARRDVLAKELQASRNQISTDIARKREAAAVMGERLRGLTESINAKREEELAAALAKLLSPEQLRKFEAATQIKPLWLTGGYSALTQSITAP